MAISRRAFGIGLLAASAAGTGGYVYLRQHPEIAGQFGEPKRLFGFAGSKRKAFSPTPASAACSSAGSDWFSMPGAPDRETVRERALLDQKPQFLWPSSSVLVDVARNSGVKSRATR